MSGEPDIMNTSLLETLLFLRLGGKGGGCRGMGSSISKDTSSAVGTLALVVRVVDNDWVEVEPGNRKHNNYITVNS